jgi:hypothetical protein
MDSDSNSILNEIKEENWSDKFSNIEQNLEKMKSFVQNEIDSLNECDQIFSELEDEVKNMKGKNGKKLIQKSYNSNYNIFSSHNYYFNDSIDQNHQDKIEEDDQDDFSFECTNIKDLSSEIYEGKNQTSIKITLKNNGRHTWPEGETILVFDKNDIFKLNDIKLQPQEPEEERDYYIELSELKNINAGTYELNLSLFINGNLCGNKLTLSIIIKSKDNNMSIINQFREKFNLPKELCKDEMILETLKKNNYNDNSAYVEIINRLN